MHYSRDQIYLLVKMFFVVKTGVSIGAFAFTRFTLIRNIVGDHDLEPLLTELLKVFNITASHQFDIDTLNAGELVTVIERLSPREH